MHTYIEDFVKTGEIKPRTNNPFTWASHVMAQNLIAKGLTKVNEVWGVEVPLYMPQMYAGTSDMVGVHNGSEAIMDHKQSNKPKTDEQVEDYKLQLVAYASAHNEVYGTKINKGVVFISIKPKTDADGLLILTEEKPTWHGLDYQEVVIQGDDFDHWTNEWWNRLEQYYLSL